MVIEQPLELQISKIKRALRIHPASTLSQVFSLSPKAAVGLIMKPDEVAKEMQILLVKRNLSDSDPWSGHMAFPGGRVKNGESKLAAVQREIMEEIGINVKIFELLGTLDELPPGNRLVVVTPFVFLARDYFEVTPNAHEISDYVWIPLSFFQEKRNSAIMKLDASRDFREVISYPYMKKYVVWGMTLKVIDDLLRKIR